MLFAKPWEHPKAVAALSIVILLSTRPTLPFPAELLLSQSQKGYLVGHHLRLSNVLERNSRSSCFMRQTLPTINWKHFFINILCIENAQQNSALR
jgi:hypothetical protein